MADEQALGTLARHLATSIQLLTQVPPAPPLAAEAAAAPGSAEMVIRYHASDDSLFIDDEYLIKGLPGRILFRLLGAYEREGRVDFTNKELRVDAGLQLNAYRDNLEARLLLLRRRLEERREGLRLSKTGRGRFRLELRQPFRLIFTPR